MKSSRFQSLTLISLVVLISSFTPLIALQKNWVFFKDKGLGEIEVEDAVSNLTNNWSSKSLERRLKNSAQLTERDLPVNHEYVVALTEMGIEVVERSRWLNAVSILTDLDNTHLKDNFEFVSKILPVRRISKSDNSVISKTEFTRTEALRAGSSFRNRQSKLSGYQNTDSPSIPPDRSIIPLSSYGISFQQAHQAGVIEAHSRGLTGDGVFLGALDTGFEFKHRAMAGVNLIAAYDFIWNDDNPSWESLKDPIGQANHGTGCLSVIVGYDPGILVGIAPRVSVAVAKTEATGSETMIEEDYWIAGMEWLEWLGVDVITSSLSYRDWYLPGDMNGFSSPASRAAQIASELGVVICNSAGNAGPEDITIGAPSDAPDVIAVAAVDSIGEITGFSSRGPSSDGRIKPDIAARGRHVTCVSPMTIDKYARWNGTSLSCPIVAGVAALVIEAHPDWNAIRVREALRMSADRSFMPDMTYGYGIVDALEAIDYPSVSGKMVSLLGEPSKVGLELALTNGEFTYTATTSQGGEFRFVNVNPGNYSIAGVDFETGFNDEVPITVPPSAYIDIILTTP